MEIEKNFSQYDNLRTRNLCGMKTMRQKGIVLLDKVFTIVSSPFEGEEILFLFGF